MRKHDMQNLKTIPVLIFILASCAVFTDDATSLETATLTVALELNKESYRIELADTPRRRVIGLMDRASLESDQGMLFLYPFNADRKIWMKNTLIPLTVIWLDEAARILKIELLTPCDTQNCPAFGAGVNTRFILELHADAIGQFKPGDELPALLTLEQPQY